MVGKQTKISTRSRDTNRFAGPPSMLDKTEPPTYRQVIQHSYFLENIHPTSSKFALSKLIAGDIIDIWKAVNPRLPLLTSEDVKCKKENCQTKHIICNCPLKQKISLLFYFSFFKTMSYTF